jgi:tRNA (cmo5U34)-methyltransferase
MRKVKQHFKQEALKFDGIINRSIPFYPQMLEAIVDGLVFPERSLLEILDLGSGTGSLAKEILLKFPKAKITVLDFVLEMLEIAKTKLSPLALKMA